MTQNLTIADLEVGKSLMLKVDGNRKFFNKDASLFLWFNEIETYLFNLIQPNVIFYIGKHSSEHGCSKTQFPSIFCLQYLSDPHYPLTWSAGQEI